MKKHIALFVITFAAGATVALAVRTARYSPDAAAASPGAAAVMADAAAPAESTGTNRAAQAEAPAPVNAICPICGMAVDPALPTAQYQGKTIGFGCKACPAEFAAHPDTYGPKALGETGGAAATPSH